MEEVLPRSQNWGLDLFPRLVDPSHLHRNTSQHLDAVPGFCLNSQVLVARPPHAATAHRLQAELGAQLGGRRAPLLVERDKA